MLSAHLFSKHRRNRILSFHRGKSPQLNHRCRPKDVDPSTKASHIYHLQFFGLLQFSNLNVPTTRSSQQNHRHILPTKPFTSGSYEGISQSSPSIILSRSQSRGSHSRPFAVNCCVLHSLLKKTSASHLVTMSNSSQAVPACFMIIRHESLTKV